MKKKGSKVFAVLLCAAMLLSVLPARSAAALGAETAAGDIVFTGETEPWDYAAPPSEIPNTEIVAKRGSVTTQIAMEGYNLPAYPAARDISNVKVLDCGYSTQNDGFDGNEYKSYVRIVTGTTQADFDTYRQSLKNAGYQEVSYNETQNGVNAGNKNCFAKFLASDGSHSVYFYRIDHYGSYDASDTASPTNHPHFNEARIVVDTNPDTVRAFSYEPQPGGDGKTELYMYGLTMSDDGWDMFNEPTQVTKQRRNCGQLIVMKMPDNSLFINDGGGTEQFNDEKTCQAFLHFCREITGVPEGQKMVINTWFITHAHRDHYSGFPTFIAKCSDQFDLKNIAYNLEGNYGSDFHIGAHPWIQQVARLYPNAKFYNLHTGEKLNIAGVEVEVLFTTEDRLRYAENGTVSGNMNDTSVVLMMRFEGKKFLLTGDLAALDNRLLSMYSASYLKADVLQVPHHGFDNMHAKLCATVNPTISFFTQNENAVNSRLAGNYAAIKDSLGKVYFGGSQTVGIAVDSASAAFTELCNEPVVLASEPYPDGVYIIKSALNQNKEIAILGDAAGNETPIHLWDAAADSAAHSFILRRQSDGTYTLQSLFTGDFIDVGTKGYLWMYSGFSYDDAQYNRHWKLKMNLDGTVTFVSASAGSYAGKVIDVQNANPANGTTIQPYDSNDSNAQKWFLEPQLILPMSDFICKTVLDSSNGHMLNVDGSNVCISNTLAERHWAAALSGDGYYYIFDAATGKYLNVDSGGNVVLDGTAPEKWSAIQNKEDRTSTGRGGTWGFVSCSTNKYLDVSNGQLADQQNVQTYQGNLTNAQLWTLTSAAHTHIKGEVLQTILPTCTGQGCKVYSCAVCGESFRTDILEATGHTEAMDKAVPATCTENGITEGKHCSVCGEVLLAQETIPAAGHTWDAGVVITPPTYTAEGMTAFTCQTCGTTRTEAIPMLTLGTLAIKQASLSLESTISINFYVLDSALEGWENPCMVFSKDIYDSEGKVIDTVYETVTAHRSVVTSKGERVLIFTFSGLTAVEMSSAVSATLHAFHDGQEGSGKTVSYSVLTYATNQLENHPTQEFADVLVDMLKYGEAAQKYWSYNVNSLPTRNLTDEQKTWGQRQEPVLTTVRALAANPGATVSFQSVTLSLEERVAINYYLNLANDTGAVEDLKLVVAYGDQETVIDGSTFDCRTYSNGDCYYVAQFSGLNFTELRTTCTAKVYSKTTGECVSTTLIYSVESYAYTKRNDETMKPLLNAMMNFGDSVKACFG